MERKRLLELAIGGVRQELNLLENELMAISKGIAAGAKTFIPGPAKKKKRAKTSTGGDGLLSFRRKPRFSAAERKRRADRMKRYWAERRKAAKK